MNILNIWQKCLSEIGEMTTLAELLDNDAQTRAFIAEAFAKYGDIFLRDDSTCSPMFLSGVNSPVFPLAAWRMIDVQKHLLGSGEFLVCVRNKFDNLLINAGEDRVHEAHIEWVAQSIHSLRRFILHSGKIEHSSDHADLKAKLTLAIQWLVLREYFQNRFGSKSYTDIRNYIYRYENYQLHSDSIPAIQRDAFQEFWLNGKICDSEFAWLCEVGGGLHQDGSLPTYMSCHPRSRLPDPTQSAFGLENPWENEYPNTTDYLKIAKSLRNSRIVSQTKAA